MTFTEEHHKSHDRAAVQVPWLVVLVLVTVTAMTVALAGDTASLPGKGTSCIIAYLEHAEDCSRLFRTSSIDVAGEKSCLESARNALADCTRLATGPGVAAGAVDHDGGTGGWHLFPGMTIASEGPEFMGEHTFHFTVPPDEAGDWTLIVLDGVPSVDEEGKVLPDAPPASRAASVTILVDGREILGGGEALGSVLTRRVVHLAPGRHRFVVHLDRPVGGSPFARLVAALHREEN